LHVIFRFASGPTHPFPASAATRASRSRLRVREIRTTKFSHWKLQAADEKGRNPDHTYRVTVKTVPPAQMAISTAPARFFEGVVMLGVTRTSRRRMARIRLRSDTRDPFGSMASYEDKQMRAAASAESPMKGIQFGINAYPPKEWRYFATRGERSSDAVRSKNIEIGLPPAVRRAAQCRSQQARLWLVRSSNKRPNENNKHTGKRLVGWRVCDKRTSRQISDHVPSGLAHL